ncbi:MAG: hypothetical protein WDN46_08055 [Methylocella sp.]
MRRLKWTVDAEKRLIEAWNAGVGPTDLAARFATSRGAINEKIRELRGAGVALRWARMRRAASYG